LPVVGPKIDAANMDPGSVLLVEDDADIREALTDVLRMERWNVEPAPNGRVALDRLRAGPPPDLMLLDLMMPVMDGFEFRVQQLQDPEIADIPVIVFSGGGDLDRKAGLLAPDAWVAKPVDVPRFLELVRRRCAAGAGAAD
jgi:CheY-like chemotaxis protein